MTTIKVESRKCMLIFVLIIVINPFSSCKKFLEERPDKSLTVPTNLQDLQSLLDNTSFLNNAYPSLLEIAADDYYVPYSNWAPRHVDERNNYIWDRDATFYNNWVNLYRTVYYANAVIENVQKIEYTAQSAETWKNIKGSAHFFRAFAFFNIAQLYCQPYDASASANALGIPLRISSDFNVESIRASVKDTYEQIIADLKEATILLAETSTVPTRPSKTAAYAMLARTYLYMEDYLNAGKYADSCLSLANTLIDYNTIVNPGSTIPFPRFNSEIIFFSMIQPVFIIYPTVARVDTLLFAKYDSGDLRKQIYFSTNSDGSKSFKGYYSGSTGAPFNGLAIDEMYLIRSECFARQGEVYLAMQDLNKLLETRWKDGHYVPLSASGKDEALQLILSERRKELLFRGLRWSDLRRLNKDPDFAITLTRILDDGQSVQTYTLPPNDLRYVLLIPTEVISQTKLQQNPR